MLPGIDHILHRTPTCRTATRLGHVRASHPLTQHLQLISKPVKGTIAVSLATFACHVCSSLPNSFSSFFKLLRTCHNTVPSGRRTAAATSRNVSPP